MAVFSQVIITQNRLGPNSSQITIKNSKYESLRPYMTLYSEERIKGTNQPELNGIKVVPLDKP
jgi:hypothetical protein